MTITTMTLTTVTTMTKTFLLETALPTAWTTLTRGLSWTRLVGCLVFGFYYCKFAPRRSKDDSGSGPNAISASSVTSSEDSSRKTSWSSTSSLDVPGSTMEERQRFLLSFRGNGKQASAGLQAYLTWQAKHEAVEASLVLEEEEEEEERDASSVAADAAVVRKNGIHGDKDVEDLRIWKTAAAIALQAREPKRTHTTLPRVARTFASEDKNNTRNGELTDCHGSVLIQLLPGRMDPTVAHLKTYALAISLYLDRKMAPHSLDRIALVIDARGGRGWKNPHAVQLLPFMKHTLQLLLQLFPDRLTRCVVYPVPKSFMWVWNILRRCLDPLTADKVVLLSGTATIASPPPFQAMAQHMSAQAAERLERERVAAFLA